MQYICVEYKIECEKRLLLLFEDMKDLRILTVCNSNTDRERHFQQEPGIHEDSFKHFACRR